MSRSRLAAVAVLAIIAATTPAYAAKPKKPVVVCNLIKDAASDASAYAPGGGATTYDPSLDILTADINVNATMITAVIRVKDLTEESQVAPTGRVWSISFSNGTQSIQLKAYLSPLGGQVFSSGLGKFDFAANQVRMHTKIADLKDVKLPKGSVLRGFTLTTNVIIGTPASAGFGGGVQPVSHTADTITQPSPAAFKVGSLSCVKVGA